MKLSAGKFINSYRWPIGIALWIILIIFQIHGSSIGLYAYMLDAPDLDPSLWGLFHTFQLDEWSVFTPLAFSQYFDGGHGAFSAISDISRAAPTDITFFYGQPCWNIVTLFRPFLWGYLFLSPGHALSFFWMGRIIILFLAAYEFGLIFTKGNKGLSAGYAALFAFAPVVQWWFSVNAFVDMLIFAQAGLIVVWRYVHTSSYKYRLAYSVLLAYFMLGYAFSIYPVWQISFGYVFLGIAIWVVYSQRKNTVWSKWDLVFVIAVLLVVASVVAIVVNQSWDTIQAILDSEYPGHRITEGGRYDWRWLFMYPLLYVMPYGFPMHMTPTGGGTFISFAPLGLIMAVWQYVKQGTKDYLVWILVGISIVFTCFFLMPWPVVLAKITLLAYVPQGRLLPAMQLIQLLILIRVLSTDCPPFSKKAAVILTLAYLLLVAHVSMIMLEEERQMVGCIVIVIFSLCACLYLFGNRRHVGLYFILVAIVSGVFANPVSSGVQSVYGTALGQDIRQIAVQNQGKWIVESTKDYDSDRMDFMNSFPIMFGAPTINSVNTYPYWPRWEAMGINEEQRKVLNRFSHMNILIVNDEPTQYLNPKGDSIIADLVSIKVNIHDLKKLDVAYIMTQNDLSALSDDQVEFQLLAADNGYYIYHVIYHK